MNIIKNIKDLYKKSPTKFITVSVIAVVGLIVAWYVTLPLIIVIFLWKRFKKDEEKEKQTKKICPHCKTEIDWGASICPHCHGKMTVWTADKKIATVIIVVLVVGGILFLGNSNNTSKNTTSINDASVKKEKSDIEVCVESEYLLKRFLKAPATAKFPTCSSGFKIQRLENDKFTVMSYVDSQNSFGAMLRSQWSITYHYTDNGTKTQLDLVIIDGEEMFDADTQ